MSHFETWKSEQFEANHFHDTFDAKVLAKATISNAFPSMQGNPLTQAINVLSAANRADSLATPHRAEGLILPKTANVETTFGSSSSPTFFKSSDSQEGDGHSLEDKLQTKTSHRKGKS